MDFAKQKWRSRFEAWLLDASAEGHHATHGDRTSEVIGAMTGTIVEIGPGTGVNMRYYAPDVKVIAIEPNPAMHERLRAKADDHGVGLEIRTLRGEQLDIDDGSADGVVGTLLLCGVEDPEQVIHEAHRVLKPGGIYFFTEHVVAPNATWTRRAQRLLRRPHRWLFNGCRVDQDTASLLRAGLFTSVDIVEHDRGAAGLHVRHGLIGTATK